MEQTLNEQSKSLYTDMYNGGGYNPTVSERFYNDIGPMNNKFLKEIKILDFGCGNGGGVKVAREYGLDAYGVDIADISNIWGENGVGQYCITYDGAKTPYKDREFGLISCCDTMEHIPPPLTEDLMREIFRIGRNFVFLIPLVVERAPAYGFIYTHVNLRPAEEWLKLFIDNGYKINIAKEGWRTPKPDDTDDGYSVLYVNASDTFPEIIIDTAPINNYKIVKEFDIRKHLKVKDENS